MGFEVHGAHQFVVFGIKFHHKSIGLIEVIYPVPGNTGRINRQICRDRLEGE
jgi:hypothetical protein